jgi:hypothetical protein
MYALTHYSLGRTEIRVSAARASSCQSRSVVSRCQGPVHGRLHGVWERWWNLKVGAEMSGWVGTGGSMMGGKKDSRWLLRREAAPRAVTQAGEQVGSGQAVYRKACKRGNTPQIRNALKGSRSQRMHVPACLHMHVRLHCL